MLLDNVQDAVSAIAGAVIGTKSAILILIGLLAFSFGIIEYRNHRDAHASLRTKKEKNKL